MVFFCAGEFVFRFIWTAWKDARDELTHFQYYPPKNAQQEKESREKIFKRKKEFGTYRILALGDSLTWGAKIRKAEDVWPRVLEGKLKEEFKKKIEVINLGVHGFTTVNEWETPIWNRGYSGTKTAKENHGFDLLVGLVGQNANDTNARGIANGNLITIYHNTSELETHRLVLLHEFSHTCNSTHVSPYDLGYLMYPRAEDPLQTDWAYWNLHPDTVSNFYNQMYDGYDETWNT